MTAFDTVRVAAVQATPAILDSERSIAKAAGLIAEAAAAGAQVVVLPETFISLYPSNAWARAAAAFGGFDELWERMWWFDVVGHYSRAETLRGGAIAPPLSAGDGAAE